MVKIIITFILFIFFTKAMLFWLWLWQLKEYHCGRMKAHFESQALRKLAASIIRFKYPKFTKKIIVIFLAGLLLEVLALGWIATLPPNFFYIAIIVLIISAPIAFSLLVLLFQIPTLIWIKHALKKAKQKREKFKDLIVIGITGSYGKTSTKEFLATILAGKFNVLKTEKHINAEIGIAQTILQKLKPEHQVFIAEIGAYERGKIAQVCRMLQPKIGILTGINEQHMSTFGSLENIIKAKFELIEALPFNGLAVFNWDNKFIKSKGKNQKSKTQIKNQKVCSTREKADLWAEDIKIDQEKITFRVFSKDGQAADFKVNLLGRQNVENILLASACAEELGMDLAEISRACRKIKPKQGPIQFRKTVSGLNILDAGYSANPDGVLADLQYLKLWPGKKIIVMPCLIELGKAAKEAHQRIGESIGRTCDLAIITTRDYFQEIKKAAIGAGLSSQNMLLYEKPEQILAKIKTFCQKDDTILLESRVPVQLSRFGQKIHAT